MNLNPLPPATVGDATVYIALADPAPTPCQRQQHERACVRALLALALAREASPEILHDADGAPFLADGSHAISISHCRGAVALALAPAGSSVGIDIERRDRLGQLRRLAPRFISPEQAAQGWDRQLLEAWSIKEAIYKASFPAYKGADLTTIPLPKSPSGNSVAEPALEITLFPLPDFLCTLVQSHVKPEPGPE